MGLDSVLKRKDIPDDIKEEIKKNISERERIENDLHRIKNQFSTLVENSTDIISRYDTDLKHIYCNKAVETLIGIPVKSIIGKTPLQVDGPPEQIQFINQSLQKTLQTGNVQEVEQSYPTHDGMKYFNTRIIPEKDSSGKIQSLLAISRDITERKRTEESLRISEEKFLKAFRSSPIALTLAGLEDGILYEANQTFEKITGYTLDESIGKTATELNLFPNPAIRDHLVEIFSHDKQTRVEEMQLRHKSGELKIVQCSSESITIDNIEYVLSTIEDITDRKNAEKAVRESELKFRTIADYTYDWEYWESEINQIIYMSPSCERITGYSSNDFMINPDLLMKIIHPDDLKLMIHHKEKEPTLEFSDICEEVIFRIIKKDSSIAFIEHLCRPIFDGDHYLGRRVSNRDITERKLVEEALRKKEKDFKEAQRLARLGSWEWDAVTDIITWSEEYYRIYGFDPTKAPPGYEKHLKAYTPESAALLDAAVKINMQTGKSYELDLELARRDGPSQWVTARSETIHDKNNKIIGLRGTVQDITERKKVEQEMRKLSAYNRNLIEVSLDPLVTIDLEGKISDVNYATELVTGYSRKELVGTDFSDYFTEPELARKGYQQVFHFGTVRDYPLEICHRDGHITSVLYNASVFRTENGEVLGVFAAARDITKRMLVEKALRESEEKFKGIYNASPIGIELYDHNGNIIDVNQMCLEIFGISDKKELENFNIFQDPNLDENLISRLKNGESIRQEIIFDFEKVHKFKLYNTVKNGTIYLDFLVTPILGEKIGSNIGYLVHINDITERKRVEEMVQRIQKLESIGNLAGGIAHEFNNLLTSIFGFIELAKSVSGDEKVINHLEKAMKTMNRAKNLTRQLLTFARGGTPIRKKEELIPFLEETVQSFLYGSNISYQFIIPEIVWSVTFDKNQISQVFQNIINNAKEAMPLGGTIDIIIKNTKQEKKENVLPSEGNFVRISVKDNGAGISKKILPRIFDPFFTTDPGKSGLGLAICHSIVKRHDGFIEVESEIGKGSAFHIYLPAFDSVTETSVKKEIAHQISGKILVMDDEDYICDLMSSFLSSLGFIPVCVKNGNEALQLLNADEKKLSFSAIFLDLIIKDGIGGKEIISEIRKLDSEIPVFVISGYSDDPIMAKPGNYGFTTSLAKPFKRNELRELLDKYLKNKSS